MFIVWRGFGFIVLPLILLGSICGILLEQAVPDDRWLRFLVVLGTALAIFGVGLYLNRRKVVGRDRWGNSVTASEDHSLYWIPVQYWAGIVLFVGGILVFKL